MSKTTDDLTASKGLLSWADHMKIVQYMEDEMRKLLIAYRTFKTHAKNCAVGNQPWSCTCGAQLADDRASSVLKFPHKPWNEK